eukprot:NODE_4956_length_436_cov_102.405685_g4292_i0.p2 GENE.NODE_4956_length_436_cov_102.405685_g4292_i0~~NODE_4956_length_436_cov_102.405685_g4292_i0.p2  ORF type:complete len:122 (+),score=48.10 NODE_4956_length_436_cov_102.405685_g4292_i0:54-368(+)
MTGGVRPENAADGVTYSHGEWNKIPNALKKRPFPLSTEVMDEYRIPENKRDYCVDKWLAQHVCHLKNAYQTGACDHEKHDLSKCYYAELKRTSAIKAIREELGH